MSDTMTPEQRSRCMAAIRGKDTKPEVLVRKFLFAKGLRFRVCNRKLPGTPDIVLPKYKTVIFIDGCFWHGHEGCKYYRLPKTNVAFWKSKIKTNKARDVKTGDALMNAGWNVIRLWECEIRQKATRAELLENLYDCIVGNAHTQNPYIYPVAELPMAAEPKPVYSSSYRLSLIKSDTVQTDGMSVTVIEREEVDRSER